MKNCLDGYLTEECKDCEWWKNDEKSVGCSTPYPISNCETFSRAEKEENKKKARTE